MTPKEAFELYENGKHRRYGLLFSVNGGAFAVAKLLTEGSNKAALGGLSLSQLALGMILFTVVMTGDIYAFGEKMRKINEGIVRTPREDRFAFARLLAVRGMVPGGSASRLVRLSPTTTVDICSKKLQSKRSP
jgi:hypothetical protein